MADLFREEGRDDSRLVRREGTVFASQVFAEGATNSDDIYVKGARGCLLIIDNTAESGTSPTLTVKLQAYDPASGKYVDITGATTTALAAQATTTLTVYPGITAASTATGVEVDNVLPSRMRVVATVGGSATPTVTASVGIVMIP